MYKTDIELLSNDEYFVDKTLNRPSINLFDNQNSNLAFLKAFSLFVGSKSGVLLNGNDEGFLPDQNNLSVISIDEPAVSNPKIYKFFRMPYGLLSDGVGNIVSNYPSAKHIEDWLYEMLELKELDKESVSVRFVNNKIKIKINKVYLPDSVTNNVKTIYFIDDTRDGPGFEGIFLDEISGFDSVFDAIEKINNYIDDDVDLRGTFYFKDLSSLPGEVYFTVANGSYNIGYDNGFYCDNLAHPAVLKFATITVSNETLTVTNTRTIVKTFIDQTQTNTKITSIEDSTDTISGALVVTGGTGIGGSLNVGGSIGISAGPLKLPATTDTTGIIFSDDIKFYRQSADVARLSSSLIVDNHLSADSLTVTGAVLYNGTVTITGATINSSPTIVLNVDTPYSEGLKSGIEIQRGNNPIQENNLPNYSIKFRELDGAFIVGNLGSELPVVRYDNPNNNCIAYWSSATKMFVTSTNLKLEDHLLTVADNMAIGATDKTIAINSFLSTDLVSTDVDTRSIKLGGAGSTSARNLKIDNTSGAANLVVKSSICAGGVAAPEESIHTKGSIRIDDTSGSGEGFKLTYDGVSKSLQFIFIGS